MAGIVNRKKYEDQIKSCDIIFDAGVHSNVRAVIANELFKYFMYERQQIPMPFDHLKKEALDKSNTTTTSLQETTVLSTVRQKRKCFYGSMEDKKKTSLISCVMEMMQRVEAAFVTCPEVKQVLITMGGTVVSPRESFLINLPPLSPEADLVSLRSSVKSLFRQLITHDLLGGVKPISPTNMAVLLYAPRDSGIQWFVPKPTFKRPIRGRQFEYNIKCRHHHVGSHDLSCDVSEVEISGIEPLDSSVLSDADMNDCVLNNCLSASNPDYALCSGDGQMETCRSSETVVSPTPELDTIWFQAPVLVKGYKDKPRNMLP
ncbi:MAD2L1-binding protein-like isoform X2 [Haliotis rufescens]|uniref:MAD2L1-binding protein-like isoform X1 n=1 Tax=Haliotis rufescens TaxID=6454 RepID=UPI00201EA5E2|nr:MAD2L1-binding protein-like isoform X1 [Haliotis rufescens]XP_048240848.1 MAD2L1-binding protein-like isoform X2 [Haliotis rufescens]